MAFSDYSDQQIFEIWERTEKYVNVNKLKGQNKQEVIQNIKNEMEKIEKNREQTQTLIEKGFVERLVDSSAGKEFYEVAEAKPTKPKVVVSRKVPSVRLFEFPSNLARQTSAERISIKIKNRFKSFKRSNISITKSTFKGKPAFYFYNKTKNKRLTWRVVK